MNSGPPVKYDYTSEGRRQSIGKRERPWRLLGLGVAGWVVVDATVFLVAYIVGEITR